MTGAGHRCDWEPLVRNPHVGDTKHVVVGRLGQEWQSPWAALGVTKQSSLGSILLAPSWGGA